MYKCSFVMPCSICTRQLFVRAHNQCGYGHNAPNNMGIILPIICMLELGQVSIPISTSCVPKYMYVKIDTEMLTQIALPCKEATAALKEAPTRSHFK